MIGCVNDAPAPLLEIVSGVDVTTEESVVGKGPGTTMPFAFIFGPLGGAARGAEATTDVSSVGNSSGALGVAAGEAPAVAAGGGFFGSAGTPVRLAFSSAAC